MAEQNIKLVVQYQGTAYSGWQWQENANSIQAELMEAIHRTTSQRVTIEGAGRTDAGVHALAQVANFRIDHSIEPERYRDALNYYLPDDIRVLSSEEASLGFHSRFDARFRRYRYLLSPSRSALYRLLRWENDFDLDLGKLHQAAEIVVGEHDFAPFCVVSSRKENNRCQIHHARWRQIGPLFVFEIRGNRFLHSMVRSLVGAMVNLASRKQDDNPRNLTLDRFENIISTSDGSRVEFTAPAHGLYLVAVGYDKGISE